MSQDHYRTLGVIDTAEDIVIRAAYKALIQVYHPDRTTNEQEKIVYSKKALEINEAYRVLSNHQLRNEYDKERTSIANDYNSETVNTDEFSKVNDSLNENWELAKQHANSIGPLFDSLNIISPQLALTFKLVLLESKEFNKASKIASILEVNFLKKYFGTRKEIHDFVKWLLENNKKDVALEVNKVIKVMGNNFDVERFILKLRSEYDLSYSGINDKYRNILIIFLIAVATFAYIIRTFH